MAKPTGPCPNCGRNRTAYMNAGTYCCHLMFTTLTPAHPDPQASAEGGYLSDEQRRFLLELAAIAEGWADVYSDFNEGDAAKLRAIAALQGARK